MLNQVALFKHFCDALWEYDPVMQRVYIYHDNMMPEICGQWVNYAELYRKYLEHFMYREDIGIWKRYMSQEALKEFLEKNSPEENFSVRLDDHSQTGLHWHEIWLARSSGHVLIGSRDMRAEQRNATVAKAVLPEYDYVCRIDIRTGSYILYYADNENTVVPQHESENYEKIMEEFNRQYVVPEEAAVLTENMRISHVVRQLEQAEEYILHAEVKDRNPQNSYKRLCFRYEDEKRQVILLTRTDVSESFRERKKRESVEKHQKELLANMPIAICSIEILLDENGKPYDFRFTYCNPAHERLEGVQPGELMGKNFYEFFRNADTKWLNFYYETAWLGIPHVIRDYSPEIGKYLLIHTFRTEPGHCDCILQDITQENFLLHELQQSREEIMRVLETMTTAVFQYDPVTGEIQQNDYASGECSEVYHTDDLFQLFLRTGHIEEDSLSILQDAFRRIRKGEHSVSVPLRCTRRGSEEWIWFKLSLFDYQDEVTKERKVMGYIQDVNRDMTRQTKLLAQAQKDALTGILNVGAGRAQIQKMLAEHSHRFFAMLIMDVDNFKVINDTHGHIIGDRTLKRLAQILKSVFDGDSIVYRLGGDEFVVFLCGEEAESEVRTRLRAFQSEIGKAREEFPFLSVSTGVYITASRFGRDYEQIYGMADKALYRTKREDKGGYTIRKDNGAELNVATAD